ncbi:MAG: SDR family NAD(P)-dependent oxidoreductase [Sphingomonadaceae bacterium]
MISRGYGRVVATSSTAGRGGYAMASAYSASKWGVIGLGRVNT